MVDEATTSSPEKKEEATASKEKEAITSGKPKEAPAPSPEEMGKKVAELEGQVEDLTKKLEQAAKLQSQADRKARTEKVAREKLEATIEKIKAGEIPVEEIGREESPKTQVDEISHLRIKNGVQKMILGSSQFQEVLKKDQTLKEIILKNPTALIEDYLDTEDAVEQIKDLLVKRVSSLEEKSQPEEGKKEGENKEFEAGPIQPSEVTTSPKKEEKQPSPEGRAVDKAEESIKSKLKVV